MKHNRFRFVSFEEWNVWVTKLTDCFQAEHHKNLVFVGPGGTGKTYLARKLAESIQVGALVIYAINLPELYLVMPFALTTN